MKKLGELIIMKNTIKCVVWDLDNTLWDGVLLEKDNVQLKPAVINIIKELDSRGILNSIASKNNFSDAMAKLEEFNISQYFLYPEINWNAKSTSVSKIQQNLNIGIDGMLFIDDQEFERDEVKSVHPSINCWDAAKYLELVSHDMLKPMYATEDTTRRRLMYIEEMNRKKDEELFEGTTENFMATLNMKFTISNAKKEDLIRVEELIARTNQMNATGRAYKLDELRRFLNADKYKVLVCELTDKYGSYGKIGVALIENQGEYWYIRLLLMSCRVISRGVGTVLLTYILQEAKKEGKKLRADFIKTERNRVMYLTYKFSNFQEIGKDDNGYTLLENDLSQIQQFPSYIEVVSPL